VWESVHNRCVFNKKKSNEGSGYRDRKLAILISVFDDAIIGGE